MPCYLLLGDLIFLLHWYSLLKSEIDLGGYNLQDVAPKIGNAGERYSTLYSVPSNVKMPQ